MFRSFRLHTYLLSSVACLYRSLRNEHIWFLYLNLKVVSQSPIYVSFVVAVVTSAWYMTFSALQFRSSSAIEHSAVDEDFNLFFDYIYIYI